MNVCTGEEPLFSLKSMKGMFSRGALEACPTDHYADCYNCIFIGDQTSIREPTTIQATIGGRTFLSFFIAQVSTGARLLTLDGSGNFYDETVGPTILGNFAGADDFAAINLFGRTYISFKASGVADPAYPQLYYYDGTVFTQAAGAGPGLASTLAQVNPGVVDVGTHQVAVSYITRTGFLTPPSPIATINSTGSNDIEVSSIPTGPGGTVGRVILMTLANQTELFFVPGGTINNNVTTTFTINVHDSALITSADYLNDIYGVLPNASSLRFYKGRLVLIGQPNTPDNILVSNLSSPETVNKVTGIVNFPIDLVSLSTCNTGLVIRDVLYIMKPNSTFASQDNGGDPSTWPVTQIDSGLGAWDNGTSLFSSSLSGSDIMDSAFVATPKGLLIFDGTYSTQPQPLTYKVDGMWRQIDPAWFYLCQVAHDVWKKRVYIGVPLNPPGTLGGGVTNGTGIAMILMMDYQEGLNYQSVRWSAWTSQSFLTIRKMTVENFTLVYGPPTGLTPIYQLAFCNATSTIYKMTIPVGNIFQNQTALYIPDTLAGVLKPINQYIITACLRPKGGGVYVWKMINMSLYGYGTIYLQSFTKYRDVATTLGGFALQFYAGIGNELQRMINITTESFELVIQCDLSNPSGNQGFFQLDQIEIYATKMWNMRPAATESH